jgi:hypothetical protein
MSEPVRMRASSWATFMDCALKWYYINIEGVTGTWSLAAKLGTAVHHATAVFDSARVAGTEASREEAAHEFVAKLSDDSVEMRVDESDIKPQDAERIGLHLVDKYCATISPQYQFRAVELDVGSVDVVTQYATIRLTGRCDRMRVRHTERGVAVSDIKTGRRAVSALGVADIKGHRAQLGVYEALAEISLGEPITDDAEIIAMQTTNKERIAIGRVRDAKLMLTGDDRHEGLISVASKMIRAGSFPPNPKSILCSEKYCPAWHRCPYHD